jgi:hypothetical protein
MIDYLKENIDEQSMRSFENADVVLAVILSALDIILVVISILNKKMRNKQIRTLII